MRTSSPEPSTATRRVMRRSGGVRKVGLLVCLLVLACAPSAHAASRLVIRGAGFGHGIGMSQYGAYGLALQGKRQYETVMIDSRTFNLAEGLLAGIEAKWLIAGGLAVAGGVYLASKDKGRSNNYSSSQNQQQQNQPPQQPAPPGCDPNDPCKK